VALDGGMSAPQQGRPAAARAWSAGAAQRAQQRQRELAEHVRYAEKARRQAKAAADRVAKRAGERPARHGTQ
jgi:hypothetical protein